MVYYIGMQYTDDMNITIVDSYSLLDMKIWRMYNDYTAYFDVDNILENEFIDRNGRLSQGRFIILHR